MLLLVVSLSVALVAQVLPAAADEPTTTRRPVAWICLLADDRVAELPMASGASTAGAWTVSDRLLCVDHVGTDDSPTLRDDILRELLGRAGTRLDQVDPDRNQQLAVVLCDDEGVSVTTLAGSDAPSPEQAEESCKEPTIPGVSIPSGEGDRDSVIPNLVPGMGAGLPTSSGTKCSPEGAANPWGQSADGSDGGTQSPRVTDAEIIGGMFGAWVSGTWIAFNTANGAGAATIKGTVGGGAGLAGLVAWGTAVANMLGGQMERRYQDAADSLAAHAAELAAQAKVSAEQAAELAKEDPDAADEAEEARLAAEAAEKAAAAAKKAAEDAAAAKTRAEVAAAYEAAKKAEAEAAEKAKAAEAARKKAADDATKKKESQNGGTGGTKTPNMPGPGTKAQETCEQLRQQLWECEQNGWRSFDCQQLERMLRGCQIDMTLALVTEDGLVCGSSLATPEQVATAVDKACGLLVAKPVPGTDPCRIVADGEPTTTTGPGQCDPTVAYGGCGEEDPVEEPTDDTICLPAPPYAPPLPCVDPTPDGGPVVGALLQADDGTTFALTGGAIVALGVAEPGSYEPGQPPDLN